MSWPTTPARFILTEVDERGLRDGEDGELLSVSISRGVVPRTESGSTQAASEDTSHYKRCTPGQLALNRLRAFQGGIGVSAHLGLVSPDYAVFDIAPSMDPRFVHYQTRSSWFVAEMTKRLRGIGDPDTPNVRTPRINTDDLGRIEMFTPPLDVQRRIADKLDAETERIDELAGMNQQVLAALDARKTVVREAEIYGCDAPGAGIHYFAAYVNGYPFKPDDLGPEGVPVIRIQQLLVPEAEVDRHEGEIPAHNHINDGDLIFSWSATLAARIWDRGHAYLNQHLFRVEPMPGIDTHWLLHAINAAVPRFDKYRHGSTMTHITRPMMTRVGVPVPDHSEQLRIARRVGQIFDEIDRLASSVQVQISLLKTRRRSMITAAVTGQLTV